MVPGEHLDSLVRRVRLNGSEWRITISVLSSPTPLSARQHASRLKLHYWTVKRVVRELVAWNVLERNASGLKFQPDTTRWGSRKDRT